MSKKKSRRVILPANELKDPHAYISEYLIPNNLEDEIISNEISREDEIILGKPPHWA